jgi:hypothetical protein
MDTGSKARTFSAPKLWIQVVRRTLLVQKGPKLWIQEVRRALLAQKGPKLWIQVVGRALLVHKGLKLWIQELTWASVRLSLEAKYSLSGPTMYCCLRHRAGII